MERKVVYRGAEAVLYEDVFEGEKAIVKERIKKSYRIPQLDERLRRMRTRKEARLLREARKVGVATPKVFLVDEKNSTIVMEKIEGRKLKDVLNKLPLKEVEKICEAVGIAVGKMHSIDIIHGDLTSSNMILKEGKIYFIDFGLGEFSRRIEDKGMDVNLFWEALKSAHFEIFGVAWRSFLKGYEKSYEKAEEVLKKAEEIEKRGRYFS